ncbi:hypothetical protein F2P81_020536 [Scophthalmus maximus]|uniref:Uncharacterized protein n=1 Tax=Scophthalmus maximus TaxID=52904 RepID=A0A6A4S695_SCOMX|nr:hypothetical protein F2P81_020536 [Scophthalmus maximus]
MHRRSVRLTRAVRRAACGKESEGKNSQSEDNKRRDESDLFHLGPEKTLKGRKRKSDSRARQGNESSRKRTPLENRDNRASENIRVLRESYCSAAAIFFAATSNWYSESVGIHSLYISSEMHHAAAPQIIIDGQRAVQTVQRRVCLASVDEPEDMLGVQTLSFSQDRAPTPQPAVAGALGSSEFPPLRALELIRPSCVVPFHFPLKSPVLTFPLDRNSQLPCSSSFLSYCLFLNLIPILRFCGSFSGGVEKCVAFSSGSVKLYVQQMPKGIRGRILRFYLWQTHALKHTPDDGGCIPSDENDLKLVLTSPFSFAFARMHILLVQNRFTPAGHRSQEKHQYSLRAAKYGEQGSGNERRRRVYVLISSISSGREVSGLKHQLNGYHLHSSICRGVRSVCVAAVTRENGKRAATEPKNSESSGVGTGRRPTDTTAVLRRYVCKRPYRDSSLSRVADQQR